MIKQSVSEAAKSKLAESGYSIVGEYLGRRVRCVIRCDSHEFQKELFVGNLLSGSKMECCHKALGVHRNTKLSASEVCERLAVKGYVLLGEYTGVAHPVMLRCEKHDFQKMTLLSNIFRGASMACCGNEDKSVRAKKQMTGAGNSFFGKKHSIETREKLSRMRIGKPGPTRGVRHSPERIAAQTGKPRSSETRKKLSNHMKRRSALFSYCVRKASSGKTAGKQGIFYIVRVGKFVKFGSATTTMQYRLTRLRQKHEDVELLAYCLVDDAGAYESSMMLAKQLHWSHGEYFHPAVLAS